MATATEPAIVSDIPDDHGFGLWKRRQRIACTAVISGVQDDRVPAFGELYPGQQAQTGR